MVEVSASNLVTAVDVLFAEDSLSTWITAEDVSTEATFAGSRGESAGSSTVELSANSWVAAEDLFTEVTFADSRVESAGSSTVESTVNTWVAAEDLSTEATVAGVGVASAGVRVASAGISLEVSSARSRGVAAGAVVVTGAVCSASFLLGTVNCASNVESTLERDV